MLASGSVRLTFPDPPRRRPLYVVRLNLLVGPVLRHHLTHMTLHQALPADIGADQGSIDVHNLCRGDLRLQAGRHRTLEYLPKPLLTPALADSGQARMVRQSFVQAIANEPADRDVDLRFSHHRSHNIDVEDHEYRAFSTPP